MVRTYLFSNVAVLGLLAFAGPSAESPEARDAVAQIAKMDGRVARDPTTGVVVEIDI